MTETTTERKSTTPDVIVRAASDPDFRARLLQDATATLAELGIVLAPQVTVKVVEDTPSVVHIVLPVMATDELSTGDLDQVAGGIDDKNESINITKELIGHLKDKLDHTLKVLG
ncbi:NHLP leader peptide family RiPP precursor [Xanthobacter flavus]|uniref:NHLP leader peptide family RiPP precursor n=1 Tax=Xanthobacter flavus TaxID=281 RepID=UPI00372BA8EF